jgi:hypothetical protein
MARSSLTREAIAMGTQVRLHQRPGNAFLA